MKLSMKLGISLYEPLCLGRSVGIQRHQPGIEFKGIRAHRSDSLAMRSRYQRRIATCSVCSCVKMRRLVHASCVVARRWIARLVQLERGSSAWEGLRSWTVQHHVRVRSGDRIKRCGKGVDRHILITV